MRAKYGGLKDAASLQATRTLNPVLGLDTRLLRWSNKTKAALVEQWGGHDRHETAHWDWEEVFRAYSEPKCFDMALWSGERLSGLAIATLTNQAVVVRFVEGDPRPDCPCRGKRIIIFLEAVALYAQNTGRAEIRIEPANSALETLYKTVYGFVPVSPKREAPYLVRAV